MGLDKNVYKCYTSPIGNELVFLTEMASSHYGWDLLFYKTLKEIMMSQKWKLYIGCHRKTSMSRDSDVREHKSLEDCRRDVKESEDGWRKMGYYVWFARAVGPYGKKVKLHEGVSYY